MRAHHFKLFFVIAIPLAILLLPAHTFPIDDLSIVEKRVIAIFLFAALSWILEPIPIYATSIVIIVLELLLISTSGLNVLIQHTPEAQLLPYRSIMATFGSPIIMLFLGGFFLALAAKKFGLDRNLANVLLKPFGTNPRWVMLGMMMITAVFSMFMSNTATTAMMLSILVPVLAFFQPEDRGKMAFALAIPLAANIGGIGTPIGTPPNAIALKYLVGEDAISFSKWMLFGVPYVILLLAFAWWLLTKLFPIATPTLQLQLKGQFLRSRKAYILYGTFALTILLWLTDFLHGMNSYVVAMIPVGVFLSTGILNKEDLKKLSWDVLWLVTGGIALGLALDQSGLASHLVNSIPFDNFSVITIIVMAAVLGALMANFMSNTATANLLLPIMAALATSLPGLDTIGGSQVLLVTVTLATSMGLTLPISTPPNALAHATGLFETQFMAKTGILVGLVGLLLIFGMMYILTAIGLF